MKQSRNTISDWLEKHGDPKIKEQVEKEAEEIAMHISKSMEPFNTKEK
jgi:serine protease inhibitor